MRFQKMKIDPPRLWWISRDSSNPWYESSPGCCESMYFPYATWLMLHVPRLACRVFWGQMMLCKAWNVFLINYPMPYPDLICCIGKDKA